MRSLREIRKGRTALTPAGLLALEEDLLSQAGRHNGTNLKCGGLGQLRRDGQFRLSPRFLFPVLDHQPDRRGADLLWLHQGLQLLGSGEGRGAGRLLFASDHVWGAVDRDLYSVLLRRLNRRLAHRRRDGDRAERLPAPDHERFASGPKAPRAGSHAEQRRRPDAARFLPADFAIHRPGPARSPSQPRLAQSGRLTALASSPSSSARASRRSPTPQSFGSAIASPTA